MIISKLSNFLDSYNLSNSTIFVAFSGGADSTALIYGFSLLSKKYNLNIRALHVNYHLRGNDSNLDQSFVENTCSTLSIPLKVLDSPILSSSSIEESARDIRYDFFKNEQDCYGNSLIATAHNANDQAETVLFRLARGTGVHGVRGIKPFREDGVIRPLLDVEREDILKWLRVRDIDWREDLSNRDTLFTRNLIRHEVIPLLQQLNPNAIKNILNFRESLSELLMEVSKPSIYALGDTYAIVPVLSLTSKSIIYETLRAIGITPSQKSVSAIKSCIGSGLSSQVLMKGWSAVYIRDYLVFLEDNSSFFDKDYSYEINGEESISIFDGLYNISIKEVNKSEIIFSKDNKRVYIDSSQFPLRLRRVEQYDTIIPINKSGSKSVLKLLKSSSIPKWERDRFPVVINRSNVIVWVPNVAFSNEAVLRNNCKIFEIVIN